tara:strand:+ start:1066 stop:1521 length:456 start_codon:yes stop_codon:yes gene_type:complete
VKIFIKNFLGILILLTIIYIVFLGFNIFKFLNSSDDLISVRDYKNTIEEYKENVNDVYSELEDVKIVSENSSIRLNFDGTPVSWVLILKQDKESRELEAIREELLQNGFNSFIFNEMLHVGPYLNKTKFGKVRELLKEELGITSVNIERWN